MYKILNIRNNIPQSKYRVNGNRYQWPGPFKSDIDFERFNGADIEDMPELEKWQELKRLESVLPWLSGKEILLVNPLTCPPCVITKLSWGFERLNKLKQGSA